MKAKEIREKTAEELEKLLREFREEMFNLRVQAKMGQMEKVSRLRSVRKDIARVLTVMGARRGEKE